MKGTTIGIDIAKNVFEVYVEDEAGTGGGTSSPVTEEDAPVVCELSLCGRGHGSVWWGPLLGT